MSETQKFDAYDAGLAGDLMGGDHFPQVGEPVNPNIQFTAESGSQGKVVGADAAGNIPLVADQAVTPPSAPSAPQA